MQRSFLNSLLSHLPTKDEGKSCAAKQRGRRGVQYPQVPLGICSSRLNILSVLQSPQTSSLCAAKHLSQQGEVLPLQVHPRDGKVLDELVGV